MIPALRKPFTCLAVIMIAGLKKKKKKPKRTDLTLREKLYLPFMWTTCATCFLGLILLSFCIAIVVIGYISKYFSAVILLPQQSSNNTKNLTSDFTSDPALKDIQNISYYFGPAVMAIGAFAIIFSCVLVCETRDNVLNLEEDERQTVMKTGPDFYELILGEMRRKEDRLRRGR